MAVPGHQLQGGKRLSSSWMRLRVIGWTLVVIFLLVVWSLALYGISLVL